VVTTPMAVFLLSRLRSAAKSALRRVNVNPSGKMDEFKGMAATKDSETRQSNQSGRSTS